MFVESPVEASRAETPTMCTIRLGLGRTSLAGAYSHPGQFLKVRSAGGEGLFAIASAPREDGSADLLIKRGRPVADALCEARPGDVVEASRPMGAGFPLEHARGHHLLLCAAGSGVGPMRAVVEHVLANRDGYRNVTLFHGQRTQAELAFDNERGSWEGGGIRVVRVCSRPLDGFDGAVGYVQDALLALRPPVADTVAFVCGMKSMEIAVTEALVTLGVPRHEVHLNY